MLTFRFLLPILFVSIQFLSLAQKVGVSVMPKSTNESNNPTKFDEDDEPKNYVPDYTMKHFVSINVGSALIGEMPIFYERNIKKHFNVQGGLGLTFDNVMYDGVVNGGHNFPYLISNTILDPSFHRHTNIGPSFMIEPKYYFGNKNYEGFYIGLQYRFRRYNYYSSEYNFLISQGYYANENVYSTVDLGKTIKEFRAVSDFLVELGGSHFFAKHFNYQYYIGVGFRNNGFYSASMSNVVILNGQVSSYQLNQSTSNVPGIAVTGGFRMGYVF